MSEVLKNTPDVYFSISTTTRDIREGEKEGVNYLYVSKQEFEKGIDKGEFLEWARVHENYYGTSLKPIKKALKEGKIVLLDIDVQGHKIAREKFPNITTSVFITTPTNEILKQRLTDRNTDTPQSIKKRIQNAKDEMKRIDEYDFLLINDDFKTTLEDFTTILNASKHKVAHSDLRKFITSWNVK